MKPFSETIPFRSSAKYLDWPTIDFAVISLSLSHTQNLKKKKNKTKKN